MRLSARDCFPPKMQSGYCRNSATNWSQHSVPGDTLFRLQGCRSPSSVS
jgi:hypothetical protein